jgi:hypothetical protein
MRMPHKSISKIKTITVRTLNYIQTMLKTVEISVTMLLLRITQRLVACKRIVKKKKRNKTRQ